MGAQAASWGLAIPDRHPNEPEASQKQKAKMLELGLHDSKFIAGFGQWQANAVLDQLRAKWLAEQEVARMAQRRQRRRRAAKIVFGLLGLSTALGLYLRFA